MEEQHFLEETELLLERASPGIRFADLVVDMIAFYAIVFGISYVGIVYINPTNVFTLYLYIYTVYILYFTLMEGATGGKTLGKYITGVRAVKEDGSRITFGDAFLRSLSRIVPFEAFSAFGGHPWHDRWTKTIVVKDRGVKVS